MENKIIQYNIKKYLSKIDFIKSSNLIDQACDSISSRITEEDSEEIILDKIYDVLFFFFSGSYLKNNPIIKDNYILLAKYIKSSINSPLNTINDMLTELIDINADIIEKENSLKELNNKKISLLKTLRSICTHNEYIEKYDYYEDEYGSSYIDYKKRKCVLCGLEERSIKNKSCYDYYDNEYEFEILKHGKLLKTNKKYEDYKF